MKLRGLTGRSSSLVEKHNFLFSLFFNFKTFHCIFQKRVSIFGVLRVQKLVVNYSVDECNYFFSKNCLSDMRIM